MNGSPAAVIDRVQQRRRALHSTLGESCTEWGLDVAVEVVNGEASLSAVGRHVVPALIAGSVHVGILSMRTDTFRGTPARGTRLGRYAGFPNAVRKAV